MNADRKPELVKSILDLLARIQIEGGAGHLAELRRQFHELGRYLDAQQRSSAHSVTERHRDAHLALGRLATGSQNRSANTESLTNEARDAMNEWSRS